MEITESKYQELISDQQKARTLEGENSKLKETAENTKIALKEGREKIAEQKTAVETLQTEFDTHKTDTDTKLAEFEWFEDHKANSEKWTKHEEKQKEARTAWIDAMKEKLGEEFLEKNKDFLTDLPEDKTETFLKQNIEASWDDPDIITGVKEKGMDKKPWTEHKTKFDDAIEKWDHMAALNEIPMPK